MQQLRNDAAQLISQYERHNQEHVLAGPDGHGRPELTEATIAFNGQAPDQDYEPFKITTSAGTGFCKTQWRPYDVIVCAFLLRATLTVPAFNIDSDGTWDQPEWANARALYTSVFGEDPGPEPFRDTVDDADLDDD